MFILYVRNMYVSVNVIQYCQ